jgi:hypothetical protein
MTNFSMGPKVVMTVEIIYIYGPSEFDDADEVGYDGVTRS